MTAFVSCKPRPVDSKREGSRSNQHYQLERELADSFPKRPAVGNTARGAPDRGRPAPGRAERDRNKRQS
jgi:hypothetical protein